MSYLHKNIKELIDEKLNEFGKLRPVSSFDCLKSCIAGLRPALSTDSFRGLELKDANL